jgi:preprotein translocase subunit SecD
MVTFGEVLETSRENWRTLLLVSLLLVSALTLFIPSTTSEGPTNLNYGLELDGGTRVRAPFVGMTADVGEFGDANETGIEATVSEELDLDRRDVQARPGLGVVEVYSDEPSREAVAAALREAGVDATAGDVRDGVAEPTRETTKSVIEDKIREEPEITGGRVQLTQTPGGDHFVLIEVPNANRSQVLELVQTRGLVSVTGVYPSDAAGASTPTPTPTPTPGESTPTPTPAAETNGSLNGSDAGGEFTAPPGYEAEILFTQEDLQAVSRAIEDQRGRTYVRVSLTPEAGQRFVEETTTNGFTGPGVDNCRYQVNESDPGYCLVTVRDGTATYAASMGPDLAEGIESGDFAQTNTFIMLTTNISEARDLRVDLQAGALPTSLDIEGQGTVFYIQPSLAERFKLFSLVTGIISALAVALVVLGRYRDLRVAAPMTLTALSEVFILLGFAAAISLPLDLGHIAGFIAVIGTGVDDLIIIADEVMAEGDVRTRRVFQSRFRKAFWVIGAAAVTTIIAMSPLTVLSLGDLSGFAIITIVGVLIGVLVTRPAYGDILRQLVTGEK